MPKLDIKDPLLKTTVEGFTRQEIERTLGPREEYREPSDVPTPLQQNIRYAYETGVGAVYLAEIYEMPVEWIELFVRDPAGNA